MSNTVESDAPEALALIEQLKACGNDPVNNVWMSGRMPPGQCLGLHPAPKNGEPGVRDVYTENGAMFKNLVEQLPEALAMMNPSVVFGKVAALDDQDVSPDHTLDPRMLPS
ncbi:MAG: hypothetical protein KDI11_09635 [Alphaproteobacteria bacterium]|nr:hypothetical protein [Alphaproteobacteria bacterium]